MKISWPVFIDACLIFLFLTLIRPAFAQVKLNEIFANPVNEDDEFVEFYNPTDQSIDISGYKLSDLTNKPYTITEATILAKSFYTIKQTTFKFQLNNTGQEVVTLKDNLDILVDSFSYDGTSEGFSFSRIPDGGGWLAMTTPSENSGNITPPSPSPSPGPSENPSPSPSTSLGVIDPSSSPSTPLGTFGPSPQPSKIFRIKDIILLQPETPEPVLGTSSEQTSTSPQIDWPLAVMFLVVGAGLLLATTIIMIRLWRKN